MEKIGKNKSQKRFVREQFLTISMFFEKRLYLVTIYLYMKNSLVEF